eukprot:93200-Pleurochrysis_carterae.AAC.3
MSQLLQNLLPQLPPKLPPHLFRAGETVLPREPLLLAHLRPRQHLPLSAFSLSKEMRRASLTSVALLGSSHKTSQKSPSRDGAISCRRIHLSALDLALQRLQELPCAVHCAVLLVRLPFAVLPRPSLPSTAHASAARLCQAAQAQENRMAKTSCLPKQPAELIAVLHACHLRRRPVLQPSLSSLLAASIELLPVLATLVQNFAVRHRCVVLLKHVGHSLHAATYVALQPFLSKLAHVAAQSSETWPWTLDKAKAQALTDSANWQSTTCASVVSEPLQSPEAQVRMTACAFVVSEPLQSPEAQV